MLDYSVVVVVLVAVVVICIAPKFLDSVQILQRFFRHTRRQFLTLEEGTFQIQPPSQQYCYPTVT